MDPDLLFQRSAVPHPAGTTGQGGQHGTDDGEHLNIFNCNAEHEHKPSGDSLTQDHAASQIDGLRRQIRRQDKKQQVRMQEVKDLIREQLKEQATKQLQCVVEASVLCVTAGLT